MNKEKIGIGEYVRIRGEILQIEFITERSPDELYIKFKEYASGNTFTKEEIKKWKHSKNIIDLIEVGDYVNGQRVQGISNISGWIDTREDVIYKNHIKSIVTKEQFKEMEYRV